MAVIALVLLNVGLIALDFYTHPHSGLADLPRRKQLEAAIGVLANYIGNYGFSSCLAMSAVFVKHGFDLVMSVKKEISPKFMMRLIAAVTLLNLTIESFSSAHGNGQFYGDVSFGFLGGLIGTLSAAITLNRLRAKENASLL